MRRSQRLNKTLIERKDVPGEICGIEDGERPISKKNCTDIQVQKGSAVNGSARNDEVLPEQLGGVGEVYSTELTNDLNCFKNKHQHQGGSLEDNLTSIKRKLKPRVATVTSSVSTAGKGRNKCATRMTTVQRKKIRRLGTAKPINKKSTRNISVDNYLNPLRNPLIKGESISQQMENNYSCCCNARIPKINIQPNNESQLPQMYPTHFITTNFADRLFNPSLLSKPVSMCDTNVQPEHNFPTPELTESLDFESSTSSLSVPESLRELFGSDNIRDVLKMGKIIFRMQILHLQVLACVLNIEYDYLYNIVQKIMKLDSETLKKVVLACQPEADVVKCPDINIEDKYVKFN